VRARGGSDSIPVFFHWFFHRLQHVYICTCTCTRGNRAHNSSGSNGGTQWLLLESKTCSKRKIHRPTETHTHHVNHLPRGFCSKSPRKPFYYFICFLRRRRKPVFICIKTLDTQVAGLISALDSLFRFCFFFPKFGYALSCPTVRGESVRMKTKRRKNRMRRKKKQKVSRKTPKDNTTAATATVADGNKSSNINNR
jgi:hypothetical protein